MRILVAEEHLIFRELLTALCRESGHEVVGATGSGRHAIELLSRQPVDSILLDIVFEDTAGGPIIDALQQEFSSVRVLVVSHYLGHYLVYRLESLRSFAGFLHKGTASLAAMKEAISAVSCGERYFCPRFREAHAAFRSSPLSFNKLLSEREQTFVRYAAQGLSDEEISDRTEISIRSVENRRSLILQKLHLNGSVQLLVYARELGFDLFPLHNEVLQPAPQASVEDRAHARSRHLVDLDQH